MTCRINQNDGELHPMNRRGFTLAELLIVVAIIAVLVAIAIPVFSSQLESSKQATDLANIRSAYAAAAGDALTNNGEDGVAETGLMKHTGPFTRISEAQIGDLDLTGDQANPIVKDYSVIVTVSAEDGSVSLSVGNGGHVLGTKASAEEIQAIQKDNKYYPGQGRDYSFTDWWADGNTMTLYRKNEVISMGSSIPAATREKTAEYGVPTTWLVNEGNSRLYFKWDGAVWYVSSGTGSEWKKLGSKQ